MHRHGTHTVNHNAQKQAAALLPLFFPSAFEYAIRKVREKLEGLKPNGKYQILSACVAIL